MTSFSQLQQFFIDHFALVAAIFGLAVGLVPLVIRLRRTILAQSSLEDGIRSKHKRKELEILVKQLTRQDVESKDLERALKILREQMDHLSRDEQAAIMAGLEQASQRGRVNYMARVLRRSAVADGEEKPKAAVGH